MGLQTRPPIQSEWHHNWDSRIHTLLQETTPSFSPTDVRSTHKGLTVDDTDADGLLLLNCLCVGEACVTNVVISGVFGHHVGEVEVTVQALRDTGALWKPLEI